MRRQRITDNTWEIVVEADQSFFKVLTQISPVEGFTFGW